MKFYLKGQEIFYTFTHLWDYFDADDKRWADTYNYDDYDGYRSPLSEICELPIGLADLTLPTIIFAECLWGTTWDEEDKDT